MLWGVKLGKSWLYMGSPKQLFWYVFFERFSKEKNAIKIGSWLSTHLWWIFGVKEELLVYWGKRRRILLWLSFWNERENVKSKSFVLYKYISTIFTRLIFQHCVGLMYKTGKLEVTADVRAKPLGQKRKRGRPAKIPLCLPRSLPNKDTLPATALPAQVPILVLSPSCLWW